MCMYVQQWRIFVVSKWRKQTHAKVTGQKKPFKYFTTFMEKRKPNLFAPMPYIAISVPWKKWDSLQHPPQ